MNRRPSLVPEPGSLRVWHITNVPGEAVHHPVKDPRHGLTLIDALAQSQLLDPSVDSNAFGMEVWTDSEWQEWEDETGYNVTDADVDLNAPAVQP